MIDERPHSPYHLYTFVDISPGANFKYQESFIFFIKTRNAPIRILYVSSVPLIGFKFSLSPSKNIKSTLSTLFFIVASSFL